MSWFDSEVDFSVLVGKTLSAVTMAGDRSELVFETVDGESYKLHHEQDCCESVSIEDVAGDLDALVGSPILLAYESSHDETHPNAPVLDENGYGAESCTWTYYRIATMQGTVNIRWFGSSNGYYSESVSFSRISAGDV